MNAITLAFAERIATLPQKSQEILLFSMPDPMLQYIIHRMILADACGADPNITARITPELAYSLISTKRADIVAGEFGKFLHWKRCNPADVMSAPWKQLTPTEFALPESDNIQAPIFDLIGLTAMYIEGCKTFDIDPMIAPRLDADGPHQITVDLKSVVDCRRSLSEETASFTTYDTAMMRNIRTACYAYGIPGFLEDLGSKKPSDVRSLGLAALPESYWVVLDDYGLDDLPRDLPENTDRFMRIFKALPLELQHQMCGVLGGAGTRYLTVQQIAAANRFEVMRKQPRPRFEVVE